MQKKQRHGCLTAWIVYLIFAYSISAITYFFKTDVISKIFAYNTSENLFLIYGSFAVFGLVFSIMLLKWMKLGFWGIMTISTLLIVIQLLNGRNIITPFLVFLCAIILYFLLQLKKGKVSGWKNLK